MFGFFKKKILVQKAFIIGILLSIPSIALVGIRTVKMFHPTSTGVRQDGNYDDVWLGNQLQFSYQGLDFFDHPNNDKSFSYSIEENACNPQTQKLCQSSTVNKMVLCAPINKECPEIPSHYKTQKGFLTYSKIFYKNPQFILIESYAEQDQNREYYDIVVYRNRTSEKLFKEQFSLFNRGYAFQGFAAFGVFATWIFCIIFLIQALCRQRIYRTQCEQRNIRFYSFSEIYIELKDILNPIKFYLSATQMQTKCMQIMQSYYAILNLIFSLSFLFAAAFIGATVYVMIDNSSDTLNISIYEKIKEQIQFDLSNSLGKNPYIGLAQQKIDYIEEQQQFYKKTLLQEDYNALDVITFIFSITILLYSYVSSGISNIRIAFYCFFCCCNRGFCNLVTFYTFDGAQYIEHGRYGLPLRAYQQVNIV